MFEVEGVRLPRPFKIVKVGPVSVFVADVDAVVWEGFRCLFLRTNTEHHSVALYPIALRERLGLRSDTTTFALGVQVASYRQLRDARDFFRERGAPMVAIPSALHPGIDYAFHVQDPDGHCLQFWFSMEQIGWDGRPRPAAMRHPVAPGEWPASIDGDSDMYRGEICLGPLG